MKSKSIWIILLVTVLTVAGASLVLQGCGSTSTAAFSFPNIKP